MLLFLFISIQLSHIASKPSEEAMEREKQFVADISHDLKTPLCNISKQFYFDRKSRCNGRKCTSLDRQSSNSCKKNAAVDYTDVKTRRC